MPTAKLDVQITGDDAKFKRTMASVEARAKRVGQTFKTYFSNVGALLSGPLGIAGAAGFGAVAKSLADVSAQGNKVLQFSRQLGVDSDNIQGWQYAARNAGVETDRAAEALRDFGEKLADARNGGGELKEVLDKYKISTKDAAGNSRRLWDVLKDVSDVVNQTGDASERLWIADKSLADAGLELVHVLGQGGDALESYAQEAKEAGFALDKHTIAKTQEATATFRVLNDEINKGKVELAEFGVAAIMQMKSWGKLVQGDFEGAGSVWQKHLNNVKALEDELNKQQDTIKTLDKIEEKKAKRSKLNTDADLKALDEIRSKMRLVEDSQFKGLDSFIALQAGFGSSTGGISGFGAGMNEFKARTELPGGFHRPASDPVFGDSAMGKVQSLIDESAATTAENTGNMLRELRLLRRGFEQLQISEN